MGADLSIFSGGKGLQGPQCSGLILGRRDLVEACQMHGNPNARIGRPMKVGKEEIAGLVAAVEWYLSLDHTALLRRYEEQVAYLVRRFDGRPGLRAERTWPSEAGQPMPQARITVDRRVLGGGNAEVLRALREGQPPIELAAAGTDAIYVNPQTLEAGQECLIAQRLEEVVAGLLG
jgi:L-seryl-tRNA(Ser) seleniumtransferase